MEISFFGFLHMRRYASVDNNYVSVSVFHK